MPLEVSSEPTSNGGTDSRPKRAAAQKSSYNYAVEDGTEDDDYDSNSSSPAEDSSDEDASYAGSSKGGTDKSVQGRSGRGSGRGDRGVGNGRGRGRGRGREGRIGRSRSGRGRSGRGGGRGDRGVSTGRGRGHGGRGRGQAVSTGRGRGPIGVSTGQPVSGSGLSGQGTQGNQISHINNPNSVDEYSDSGSVSTVDDPVMEEDVRGDRNEEEDEPEEEDTIEDEEVEKLLTMKQHWRSMNWDPDTKRFYFDGNDTESRHLEDMPAVDGWKKNHPRDLKRVRVLFDGARESMIGIMKAEYEALENRLEALGIEKSSDGLKNYLFGERSQFAQAVSKNLGLSHDQLSQFLATFYAAAEWGRPAKRLEESERFLYEGFMNQKMLNSIWRDIGVAGKDGTKEKLWIDVQEALNKDCRELFLTEGNGQQAMKIYVALDDDKVRFQFSTAAVRDDKDYLCGMKGCQHTKANCRGFTIDSAVSSVTGFPLNFSVLRQGETNTQNYDRIVRFMFSHRFTVAGAMMLALSGITFCSDRGYWTAPLILLLLDLGATVFGTLRRMEWVPYTYDQPIKGQDKRERIQKKYGRSVFQAFARWGIDMLKVLAWRSGTGSVSLAMTSDCDEDDLQQFDFCFKNNGDAKWYKAPSITQDERNLKAFHGSLLKGKEDNTEQLRQDITFHLKNLANSDVKMLNCSDHCLAWFVLRMFSFTSSSTEATLRCTAPYIPSSSNVHPAFKRILGFAGLGRHLSKGDAENDLADEAADAESSESSASNEVPIDGPFIKNIISSMRLASQSTVNNLARDVRRVEKAIDDNTLTPAIMSSIMVALGFTRERAGVELSDMDKKKKVKKWIKSIIDCASDDSEDDEVSVLSVESSSSANTVPYKFPYDILNAAELKSLLLSRVGSVPITTGQVPGPFPNPTKADQRKQTLVWLDENPEHLKTHTGSEQTGEDTSLRDAILSGAVSRAFLRSLEGKEKVAAKLGHQNEPNYIKQYFEDSKKGRVPGVELCDVMRCGLAMKQGSPFVRDSADAIAFEQREPSDDDMEDFDRISSHLVECKCRSGSGSDGTLKKAQRIQKRVATIKGGNAHVDIASGRAVYFRVGSHQQSILAELIPSESERIQLLHHAHTYNRDTVAYLVGDPHGKILFGIIVTFDEELLESYGEALQFLYDNGLNLFYSNDIEDLPMDLIEGILLGTPKLKSKFQLNDFMTSFLIWRELLPDSPDNHKFPIPACDMLLPYEHSLWNSCKGGSDTVTRFTWNCLSVLPIKMPQTAIVARFFLIYAVVFHRARQVVTMKKKVQVESDTVQSVRERNNKRYAFHQSLGYLSKVLLKMAGKKQEEKAAPGARTSFEQMDADRFNPDNVNKRYKVDHSVLGSMIETGVTPFGKGKVKSSIEQHDNYQEYKSRIDNCTGCPVRIYKHKKNSTSFVTGERNCDLCGSRAVSWMCQGCKRVLCADKDRSKTILKRLQHKDDGPLLCSRYPALANLSRGNVPAYYTDIGSINGSQIFAGMSCFHLAHPKHFCNPLNEKNEEEPDAQLMAVASSASADSSHSPTTGQS